MASKILTAVLPSFISIENKVIHLLSKLSIFFIILNLVNMKHNSIFASSSGKYGFALDNQIGFATPASPIMEGIICFHDDLFIFLSFILGFIMYIFFFCIYNFGFKNKKGESEHLVHASTIEIIWTIIPILILIVIAIPSFSLLYSMDEIIEPLFSIKVIGHQWYWSYEFLNPEIFKEFMIAEMGEADTSKYEEIIKSSGSFDSYMVPQDEIKPGSKFFKSSKLKNKKPSLRLLSVDNYLHVPVKTPIRVLVSSSDVLHSWAVPSLGIKVDACPGRLNQTLLYIKRSGFFFGQCSEICGVNHGFMPIGIKAFDLGFTLNARTFLGAPEVLITSLEAISRE